ncbi:MAG: COX15/CtaA family protein [Bacteroidota bacterium]
MRKVVVKVLCVDFSKSIDMNEEEIIKFVVKKEVDSSDVSASNYTSQLNIPGAVKIWLCIGIFMVFMQVVIGGITRLTGSGLSITKWEIVTGTLPPLSAAEWEHEFELYKQTPQYDIINFDMEMGSIFQEGTFKFIYFWEYLHRLWARSMGFVFAIPFFIFWRRGMLSKTLMKDLGIVILLAMVVASMGWIMVASGLIDRPWVNGYKLTMHLSLAFILASYLLWTTFKVFQPSPKVINNSMLRKVIMAFLVVLSVQIIFGGLMSGMKAGLQYPTWPDMNGKVVPAVVLDGDQWNVDNLVSYDTNGFTPAIVQVVHRTSAYLLILIGFWYFFLAQKVKDYGLFQRANIMWITMLVIQILLGIFTVINCRGSIPVGLGVMHQGGALLLLGCTLFCVYLLYKSPFENSVSNHVGNVNN